MHAEQSIPILPCRSVDATAAFYTRLGFQVAGRVDGPEPYLKLRRGGMEVHFWVSPDLDPAEAYTGCYFRLPDADPLYAEYAGLGLPPTGFPAIGEIEDKPWGMREFHVIDPDGNLLRIGHRITGGV